jgi:hypothetical protein
MTRQELPHSSDSTAHYCGHAAACAVALACLLGCGYRHATEFDNILAAGWTSDGVAISLAQHVTIKSDMRIPLPDAQDPRYDLGPFVLLGADGRRRMVAPELSDWWQPRWVAARSAGHGFVMRATKGAPGHEQDVCLIVDESGATHACSFTSTVDRSGTRVLFLPATDQVLLWNERDSAGEALDLDTGRRSVASVFVPSGFAQDRPCRDRSYAALSPKGDAWALVCQDELWVLDARTEHRFSVEAPPFLLSTTGEPLDVIDDLLRPWSQRYGLAWSPDQQVVYWCAGPGRKAVFASTQNGSTKSADRCVTGAAWSPDGRSIAGREGHTLQVLSVTER